MIAMTLYGRYGALCVSMAAMIAMTLWPLWRSMAAMGRCVSMAAMALYGHYGALCLPDSLWPL